MWQTVCTSGATECATIKGCPHQWCHEIPLCMQVMKSTQNGSGKGVFKGLCQCFA